MGIISKESFIKQEQNNIELKKLQNNNSIKKLDEANKKLDDNFVNLVNNLDKYKSINNIYIDEYTNEIFSDDKSLMDKFNCIRLNYRHFDESQIYELIPYFITHKTGKIYYLNKFNFIIYNTDYDQLHMQYKCTFKVENFNDYLSQFKQQELLKTKVIKSFSKELLGFIDNNYIVNIHTDSFMYEVWQGLITLS